MKLSQWHTKNVKPVHIGLYQTKVICGKYIYWSWWNGEHWATGSLSDHSAIALRDSTGAQEKQWRGVVK